MDDAVSIIGGSRGGSEKNATHTEQITAAKLPLLSKVGSVKISVTRTIISRKEYEVSIRRQHILLFTNSG